MQLTSEATCRDVKHSNPVINVTLSQYDIMVLRGIVDTLLNGNPSDDPFL